MGIAAFVNPHLYSGEAQIAKGRDDRALPFFNF